MHRSALFTLIIIVVFVAPISHPHTPTLPYISSNQPTDDLALARTYTPVLYFHERERYRPQDIRVMLDRARLRQNVSGVDATLRDTVAPVDLATAPADAWLDLWYGSDHTSGYLNYTAHGSVYDASHLREAYPITTYARVVHADDGRIVIQYWLFYYYNDWYNKHEGDWEMIQVELDAAGQATRAVYAQHHGGTLRPWSAVGTIDGTHPQAYVALGSHATYFAGDALYPQGIDLGAQRIEVYDRTGHADPIMPDVQLITDADPTWLAFAGRWGERAPGDFSGPTGPAQKQAQWTDPLLWADLQPSDAATWYHQNARAEVNMLPYAASLLVIGPPNIDTILESSAPRQTIIVRDQPDVASRYDLQLQANLALSPTLKVEWPDVRAGLVTRREYALNVPTGTLATMPLCAACDFTLRLDTNGDGQPDRSITPIRSSTHKVNFDPPQSVIFYLPFEQIILGLLIAVLAAVIPSAVYALGVWWLDRYEKEPIQLLVTVFVWGAIPGALVALVARFFVAGPIAPVLTELVKAAEIGFIYTRYRREFDDILDGIVYGAMTGVGYAMMINLIDYAVGFFYGGFGLLGASVLFNGVAFGLNEAYYGAVIGIGFGVSRWSADRRVRVGAPIAALAVAVILHLFTDFWRDLAVSGQTWLVIIPFLATWAGILGIVIVAFVSIRREQAILRAYLKAEVDRGTLTPEDYADLSTPSRRAVTVLRSTRRGPIEWMRAVSLQNLATQLAFRLREAATFGHDPDSDGAILGLRQRIAALKSPAGKATLSEVLGLSRSPRLSPRSRPARTQGDEG